MAKFYPASHDVVFKALFVYHEDVLRAFLRDILDLPITDDAEIDVKNPEIIPVYANGKLCRLDIHVKTASSRFNIEMQARALGFSPERVLYYWSKMFIAELESGDKYEQLEQTYSVNVLGFRYFDCEDYHSSFAVMEDSRYERLSDKLSIHIFELPKVPDKLISGDRKQVWMELIKAESEEALDMVKASTQDPMIRKAIDAVLALNADEALREQIRQRDKAIRDYENDMAVSRDAGREEGRAEGREEGRAEGIAEGRAEGAADKAAAIAVSLIKKGIGSLQEIAELTGLSAEQVEQLAGEHAADD